MYFFARYGTRLAGGSTHGQTWRLPNRRAIVGQDRTAPPTDASVPAQSPLGEPSGCRRRYFVGAEDGGSMARPARGVSESVDVLASPEALGRGRDVAPDLAHDYRGAGRTWPVAVGNRVHRRHLCPGEKGGSDIGPTKRHLRVAARGVCQAKGDGPPAALCGRLQHPAHGKEQRANTQAAQETTLGGITPRPRSADRYPLTSIAAQAAQRLGSPRAQQATSHRR